MLHEKVISNHEVRTLKDQGCNKTGELGIQLKVHSKVETHND